MGSLLLWGIMKTCMCTMKIDLTLFPISITYWIYLFIRLWRCLVCVQSSILILTTSGTIISFDWKVPYCRLNRMKQVIIWSLLTERVHEIESMIFFAKLWDIGYRYCWLWLLPNNSILLLQFLNKSWWLLFTFLILFGFIRMSRSKCFLFSARLHIRMILFSFSCCYNLCLNLSVITWRWNLWATSLFLIVSNVLTNWRN